MDVGTWEMASRAERLVKVQRGWEMAAAAREELARETDRACMA